MGQNKLTPAQQRENEDPEEAIRPMPLVALLIVAGMILWAVVYILYTEPPSYPRPVVEGWANVALALGDYTTAEKGYREALEREPGSGRAFFGLAASLEGQGKTAEAREAKARAAKAWANADANLPQMQKLRTSTAAVAQP